MSLDKNILAQSEQLIQNSADSLLELEKQLMGNTIHLIKTWRLRHTISTGAFRELAVFRMLEAIWEAPDFKAEDLQELKSLLEKVRESSTKELEKHLTPEQKEQMKQKLDQALAKMSETTVSAAPQ